MSIKNLRREQLLQQLLERHHLDVLQELLGSDEYSQHVQRCVTRWAEENDKYFAQLVLNHFNSLMGDFRIPRLVPLGMARHLAAMVLPEDPDEPAQSTICSENFEPCQGRHHDHLKATLSENRKFDEVLIK